MLEGDDTVSGEALADVAYLSRSSNRVRILDALTDGPSTRRELAEKTGASRTTLDRIVNELEERGWAERTPDGEYVATPTGAHLMGQFDPFLGSVEAIERLGERVAWLPTDELEIDLRHFRDASVHEPDHGDPVDTVDFMIDCLRDTSQLRVMTHFTPPDSFLAVLHRRVVSGELSFESVVPAEQFEALGKTRARREGLREVLEAGGELYRCEGPIPCNLWLFDDLVMLKKSAPGPIDDAYGVPILSENSEVRSWAHELLDRYRADATAVGPGALDAAGER